MATILTTCSIKNLTFLLITIITSYCWLSIIGEVPGTLANIYSPDSSKPESLKRLRQQVVMDTGYELRWDSDDPYYLTMEMSAPTRGYLGVGFSPTGEMIGADIVIGWVDLDGVPFLRDYHGGTENGTPLEDSQQDYELIGASERDGQTTIRFRRRWETCDENDFRIENDTVRVIWAWHQYDPVTVPTLSFPYHGQTTRGVRSILLRTYSTRAQLTFPDDRFSLDRQSASTWDVTLNNVRVGSKNTSYFCKIVKFPRPDKKHHMIGYRPLITQLNRDLVYHVSVYHCIVPENLGGTRRIFDQYLTRPDRECVNPNVPVEWSRHCLTYLLAWGIGSEGQMFPLNVGSPLGGRIDDSVYFKLEVHYHNPRGRTFIDSSGIRIFYTDTLRRYDSGTLFLGHRVTPFHMIPFGQRSFTTYSFCSRDCTQNGIKHSDGLKTISVLLHGHSAARGIRVRHVRDGRELPPLSEDNNYDFKYQSFRPLGEEITILPGDELLVECDYDTTYRNSLTFGGLGLDHEVCQAIIHYYPKDELADCRSQPELYNFINSLGVLNVTGQWLEALEYFYDDKFERDRNRNKFFGDPLELDLVPPDDIFQISDEKSYENPFETIRITSPTSLKIRDKSLWGHIRTLNWQNPDFSSRLSETWKNGKHFMFCSKFGQRRISIREDILRYPSFQVFRDTRSPECRYKYYERGRAGSKLQGRSWFIIILVVISVCSIS